jgi:nucleotide-binding universal stress UspA family protein
MTSASQAAPQTELLQPHLETSPPTFRRILVATDFSPRARLAAQYAARLAQHFQAALYLLHAVPPYVATPGVGTLTPLPHDLEVRRGEEQLHKHALRIPEVRAMQHEEIVLSGPVRDVVIGCVEDRAIDLVVTASQSRTGAAKLVLGSNAEAILRHLHRPVLILGHACRTEYQPFTSVVFATDLPVHSLRAAQYAFSLAQESHAEVLVMHVFPGHASTAATPPIEQLEMLVPSSPEVRARTRFELTAGSPPQQIVAAASQATAGLIVMGVRQHGILADHAPWSTLSAVIARARCPVLAVPAHL